MNTKIKSLITGLSACAVAGLVTFGGISWAASSTAGRPETAGENGLQIKLDSNELPRDERSLPTFAPVVKKVAPSVVKIMTATKAKQGSMPALPPSLRRFFGEGLDQFMPERGGRMPYMPQHGVGSGVIVTPDGFILTNNHVVEGADELKVTLHDGRELTAKVIGKDPKTDVAVVKVDAKDLPALEMADSEKIEIGDIVLAVGNPFGIGQTVTMGMVSATGRATLGLDYEDFIQTDAAINPGNSGGALVDAAGRLVGINTAILSRTGGNQGIGFAIPVNMAREVMTGLVKDGRVTRGYLGVRIQDVDASLAKEFKLADQHGALVGDVTAKSPAEKAGIESGDIIVELNSKPVKDSRHLKLEVARVKPGDAVNLKVLRDGKSRNVKVNVGELPSEDGAAKTAELSGEDNGTLNGVEVANLDDRTRKALDIPERIRGAVITAIEPGSASAEAGLQEGDVILEINRQKVQNAEEAVRLTEKPADHTTLLKVWSRGGTRYVVVDESKEK